MFSVVSVQDWEKVRVLVTDLTELVMAQNDQAIEQEAHFTEAEHWQENESQIHTELWEELENKLYV